MSLRLQVHMYPCHNVRVFQQIYGSYLPVGSFIYLRINFPIGYYLTHFFTFFIQPCSHTYHKETHAHTYIYIHTKCKHLHKHASTLSHTHTHTHKQTNTNIHTQTHTQTIQYVAFDWRNNTTYDSLTCNFLNSSHNHLKIFATVLT